MSVSVSVSLSKIINEDVSFDPDPDTDPDTDSDSEREASDVCLWGNATLHDTGPFPRTHHNIPLIQLPTASIHEYLFMSVSVSLSQSLSTSKILNEDISIDPDTDSDSDSELCVSGAICLWGNSPSVIPVRFRERTIPFRPFNCPRLEFVSI